MAKILSNNYSDGFFDVTKGGFLPVSHPLEHLPTEYEKLDYLVNSVPQFINNKLDDELVDAVKLLPNYADYISKENNVMTLQALYRSYTMVASTYLLMPSYLSTTQNGYGKARTLLPANISIPLVMVSEKLNTYPFLDYAYAYVLGNYKKIKADGDMTYENLRMINSFTNNEDENGFVMVHVDIESYSKQMILSMMSVFNGLDEKNQETVVSSLKSLYEITKKYNERRLQMWKASDYKKYNTFRAFIMGIEGNEKIFGEGVVYDQCFDNKPQKFRGQTGAQSSLIPSLDIFTGIVEYYPKNDLTAYLIDLRKYRPQVVQQFLKDLYTDSKDLLLKIKQCGNEGLTYLLATVNEIYKFRNGHWQFVQKYIMENTTYGTATGGTSITQWIPNQIKACLDCMSAISHEIKFENKESEEFHKFEEIYGGIEVKKQILQNQLDELHKQNYNPQKVYDLNQKEKEF